MQSRNKREGKYLGKFDGLHNRDKQNHFKGEVWSDSFEPRNRKQRKILPHYFQVEDLMFEEEF